MGDRSSVYVVLSKDAANKFHALCAQNKKLADILLDYCDFHEVHENSEEFIWEGMYWRKDINYVNFLMNFLKTLDVEQYAYLRRGADIDDIVIDGMFTALTRNEVKEW